MMQGMRVGMTTLGWAMILFLFIVYVCALVFRESFGREEGVKHVSPYFNSVPRSMFTTFRCSFGDCSDAEGVPIFEYVYQHYGQGYSVLFFLFVFIVTIGLFNVISAIFVQSVTDYALQLQSQRKKARLQDEDLWCSQVAILIRRLLAYAGDGHVIQGKLTDSMDEVYDLEVDSEVINQWARDDKAVAALEALDITAEDREFLSEILDPDGNGTINVIEIVEGLGRLRGEPRRSDIVTVNLILRSLQRQMEDLLEGMREVSSVSEAVDAQLQFSRDATPFSPETPA